MEPFQHQAVRDLAWLIGSPPLMAAGVPGLAVPDRQWLARIAADAQPWLADLDNQPEELQRVIYDGWMGAAHASRDQRSSVGSRGQLARFTGASPPSPRAPLARRAVGTPRIGHYAERLLEFWLSHHPGMRLIAARRAVRGEGRDLGDLDVVFSYRYGPPIHWELAVKFFLRARDDAAWDAWIGPNPRDRLDRKLERVIGHQLPLGGGSAASAAAGLGRAPLTSEAFLKGWLFHPVDGPIEPSPAGASPDHGRGWWLHHGEHEPPQAARSSRYLVPERLEWLAPQHRPDDGSLPPLSHRQLLKRLERSFERHMAAVLVCEVQRDQHGWWREIDRGFVVHPRWPEIIEAPER
ncbi:MAG TPA: DUF1853 family protein [Planctomycetota bacterium]|nr:DUF1853 family protein [Planctomycetota bacterium]